MQPPGPTEADGKSEAHLFVFTGDKVRVWVVKYLLLWAFPANVLRIALLAVAPHALCPICTGGHEGRGQGQGKPSNI
jgi:hypothetical protein